MTKDKERVQVERETQREMGGSLGSNPNISQSYKMGDIRAKQWPIKAIGRQKYTKKQIDVHLTGKIYK